MKQYILYLNLTDSYCQLFLPTENNRKYTLDLSAQTGCQSCVLELELLEGLWWLVQSERVRLTAGHETQELAQLSENEPVHGILAGEERFSAWIREASARELQFEKLDIRGKNRVTVGSAPQADLQLNGPYISREHLTLYRQDGGWVMEDTSRNGVYLNNRRVPARRALRLPPLGHIYTGGFHMVLLGDMLAVNCTDQIVSELPRCQPQTEPLTQELAPHEAFLRSPRFYEPLPQDVIDIEAPPQKRSGRRQPLLFVLGPALTMPLPMLTTMLLRMGSANGAGTYWIMGVSVVMSAAIGLGWSLARRKYDEKEEAADERTRRSAYAEYLGKNEKLLQDRQAICRERLLRQYPSTMELFQKLMGGQEAESLWNRNVRSEDFLTVRLGFGRMDISGMIKTPPIRFSVTSDDLEERPGELKAAYQCILQVPSLLAIASHKLTGLIGRHETVQDILSNIVLQLAMLHSYTDVRLICLLKEQDRVRFGWLRWLPHTFSPDRSRRLVACTEQEHAGVLSYLLDVLRARQEEESNAERSLPYYVVVCTDPNILYNHAVYRYLTSGAEYHVQFLLAYERLELLPNECNFLIQADESFCGAFRMDENRSETDIVTFDHLPPELPEQMARRLSRYWVNELSDGEIPGQVEFLEMYHLTDITNWDLLRQWKTHRAYESIRAQIGVSYGGQPVYLDIHEKQHGPHGLVAGTTGSGKSELIQTFVLSLMLNYHPDEVAFILIDYKGGGMSNLFGGTPHVAGVITNISETEDGESRGLRGVNQTQRALLSLKSEIRRRQKLFGLFGVNHIDQYNRLYRQGTAAEPLPHLIIISDEFAELKKEQPDFIKELVSTARVGRSLGVHLILATQKPSGVVDEEIWSNARFKLCLKVQDRQDSMEILKRPEAAELTKIGRGYLQIGNDELFEIFQSGYSGADYQPELDPEELAMNTIELLSLDGTRTHRRARCPGSKSISQLDACVAYITETAQKAGVRPARKLWLPMLEAKIALEPLLKAGTPEPYAAIIGKIDYPEQQMQPVFAIRFPRCGNVLIVGSAGSGKSTLAQGIIYALCVNQRPEEFIWYALDCSNHRFDALSHTPHCGAVVYPEDEERVERLFAQLQELMQTRKQQLADASCANAEEYRARGKGVMPLTLVVIDNYAGFMENYEPLSEPLLRLLREGLACGICFLVTMNTPMDMRGKWAQNFATSIPLLLNERADYFSYLGTTPQLAPTGELGSGLTVYNGSVVQFQSAFAEKPEAIGKLAKPSQIGYSAPPLRYIDKNQLFEDYLLKSAVQKLPEDELPLGWYTKTIRPYALRLRETFCYFISDCVGLSARSMTENILLAAAKKQLECHVVRAEDERSAQPGIKEYRSYDDILLLMSYLRDLFKRRATEKKQYLAAHPGEDCEAHFRAAFPQVLVVFEDYNAFCGMCYNPDGKMSFTEVWETLLKNGKGYGVTFLAVWNRALYQQSFQKPACRLFAACQTGVHLGGRLDAQRAIETGLSITEQTKMRPPETGFALQLAQLSQVFIPRHSAPEEEA